MQPPAQRGNQINRLIIKKTLKQHNEKKLIDNTHQKLVSLTLHICLNVLD